MDIAAPEHVVISSEDDTLSTAFPLPAVHHMGSVSNSTRSTFSQDWESVYRLDDHNPDSMYTTASSTLAMPNSRPPSNTNELPLPVSRTNPSYSGSDPTSDVVYNTSYPPRSSVQFNPSDSSALSRTSHPSTTYVPGFASSPGTATAQDYRGPGSHIVSYGHPPASFDHAFSSSARTVNTPNPPSNINRPPLPIFDYNLSYYGLPPGVGYGSYAPRLSNQFTPLYPSSLSYSFHSSVPQTPSFASSPVTAPARSHPGPRSHSAGGKSRVSIIDETPVGSWTTSFSGGPSSQIDHISRPSARKRFGACGSCQIRQVKCDLVEKASQEGGEASCTACIDRGINCVAYPQFPKPKAHRRSKKAINVEAIAGKKNHGKEAGSGGPGAPEPLSTSGKAHLSLIPSTIAADDLAWGTTGNTNPHHDLDARDLEFRFTSRIAHDSAVHCVQFSVDGQYLAVSCDGEIRISDAKTGTIVCVLAHQTDEKLGVLPFRAMCFTLDGNYLAAGSDDKNIWIWDIAERAIQTSLVGHSKEITSLTTSPDGKLLISGSNDGTVRIWEIQTWNCSVLDIIEPRKMNIGVKSVAVSSDCLWVAAGSMDGVIRIWDIRNKALVERLRGHWEPVSTVNFRGDSPQLISGSWDNALKCWDIGPMVAAVNNILISGELDSLSLKQDKKKATHFQPVLIGEEDGVGERGSRCCLSFAEHKDEVLSAVVSPSGDWVASCSTDGAVKIWNPSTAETWLETEGHNGPFTFVALNSVGLLVASGANSHTCIWHCVPTAPTHAILPPHTPTPTPSTLSFPKFDLPPPPSPLLTLDQLMLEMPSPVTISHSTAPAPNTLPPFGWKSVISGTSYSAMTEDETHDNSDGNVPPSIIVTGIEADLGLGGNAEEADRTLTPLVEQFRGIGHNGRDPAEPPAFKMSPKAAAKLELSPREEPSMTMNDGAGAAPRKNRGK